jgi:hypothetical protein
MTIALRWLSAAPVLGALSIAACSSSDPAATGATGATGAGGAAATTTSSSSSTATGAGGAGGGAVAGGPTFHADIEPLLQKACVSCHAEGRIAPFALTTYATAKPLAGLLALRTADRSMPPWGAQATDACAPRSSWIDDARLTDAEIALFDAWAKAGAPEGDPDDAPAPKPLPADGLPGVEQELAPAVPFKTSGKDDQLRCFVLDPKIAGGTKFISGTHVIAGDPKVVHHALVFTDPDDEASALAGPDGSYECFGGPGIANTSLLAAWAPGGRPAELPEGAGLPIAPGTKLVVQIHYHPAGGEGTDATTVQLRYTKGQPKYGARVDLIGNFDALEANGDGLQPGADDPGGEPAFLIPAGAKGHVEDQRFTIPDLGGLGSLRIYGLATHMHYVGTNMTIEVERKAPSNGDPAAECLLGTPRWDFNWQRFYMIDAPIESLPRLAAGDVLKLRCTYDNTKQNPFVAKALLEQGLPSPVDVKLGETTLDEMCLGAFMTLFPL